MRDAVDMACHEMAAKLIAKAQGRLEINFCADLPVFNRGFIARFGRSLYVETLRGFGDDRKTSP